MAWWNPADWVAGTGKKVADRFADAIVEAADRMKGRIISNPEVIVAPTAVVIAAFTAVEAGRAFGQEWGRNTAITLKQKVK